MIEILNRYTNAVLHVVNAENLSGANLSGANLSGANLSGANLSGANLSGANLIGANLNYANLNYANLNYANLIGANLNYANLNYANLNYANLSGANLIGANLNYANLSGANLNYANLNYANLNYANLSGANLSDANLNYANAARLMTCPSVGSFTAWKKCEYGVIVKLTIPEDARRSSATSRKCRAEFVDVVEVFGAEFGRSQHDSNFVYKAGDRVKCHEWCEDRWQECAGGIHFFITREEAEAY